MLRNGIGESSEFSRFHPLVNLAYFVIVIGITMFSMSPAFLLANFMLSWIYSILLRGSAVIKQNLIVAAFTLIVMSVINLFFTHEGVTVLFYLNDNAITLEALMYGLCSAAMLISVITWFVSFNVIMSSEKLIYIFGKTAPVIGLTLSMIFRYVPLLKERYAEIHTGQMCMGRGKEKGFLNRMRQFGKEVSILISWSLESSIESADSMEARGYGLKGRTSFHLYRLQMRDICFLSITFLLALTVIYGKYSGKDAVSFYPDFRYNFDLQSAAVLLAYSVLAILPALMDVYGEMKWKQSKQ